MPRRGANEFLSAADEANSKNPVIVFIGNCVVFSDRLLRLVELEFDEIDVLRLHDMAEVSRLDALTRAAIQLIIVDEASADSLPQAARELEHAAPGSGAVLAYRTAEIARDMLNSSRRQDPGAQLRFLPMRAPIDAWLSALRLLSLGEDFVPVELVAEDKPHDARSSRPLARHAKALQREKNDAAAALSASNLTRRETQILEMVAEGKRNKVIARDLGLSEHTVKLHVHHIFGKLGVSNRTSATNWYMSKSVPSATTGGI